MYGLHQQQCKGEYIVTTYKYPRPHVPIQPQSSKRLRASNAEAAVTPEKQIRQQQAALKQPQASCENRLNQILEQLREILAKERLPYTRQIMESNIKQIQKVAREGDAQVIESVLPKLESSIGILQFDSSYSYNLCLYMKELARILQK